MIKKTSLTIALLLALVGIIKSQSRYNLTTKQLTSVGFGIGVLSFDGDIGVGLNLTSLSRVKSGYTLCVEQRFGKIIGVSLNCVYGKIADGERGAIRNLNFESKIFQSDLNLVLHLDNNLLFKYTKNFSPYILAGFGFLKFNSFGDLKNKNGIDYNYWADGTIRSLPDSTIGSQILRRDYTYETKLNETNKYSNNTFIFPLGCGLKIKIVEKFYINLAATYYFTSTDWIDNFKNGKNDRYIFTNITIQYNLGDPFDDSNPVYQTVDFVSLDSLDSDKDGIYDAIDVCPGTPKNVLVTLDGCPQDSDSDGVPDYMDKEVLTIVGRFVDENGEAITEQMFEDRNRRYNSLATERSQLFNENPSFKYLKKLEAQSRSTRKNNPKEITSIPAGLMSSDLDDDGYISADELLIAIDAFFDGNSGVENLNVLIDFFFEQ